MRRQIILAGALAASTALAGTAHGQSIRFSIGDGDFNISVWQQCGKVGNPAGAGAVRQSARAQGYRNIGNVDLVNRRYGNTRVCGFYRATAQKQGRRYRLYANARNGRLLSARVIGRAGPGRGNDAQIGPREARRAIRQAGYRNIRNLRQADRNGRTFWVARAAKDGADFRVFVRADTGAIARQVALNDDGRDRDDRDNRDRGDRDRGDRDGRDGIDAQRARREIRQAGYRNIRELRSEERDGLPYWVAIAAKGGAEFRLWVRKDSGNIVRETRLGQSDRGRDRGRDRDDDRQIGEARARREIRQAGYRDLRNLRQVERDGRTFWVARAAKDGADFRVFVRADTGAIARQARIGEPELDRRQARQRIRQAGYRKIRNLRRVERNGRTFWVARAARDGAEFRVFARADNGRIARRIKLSGRRADPQTVVREMRRDGYRNIENLRFAEQRGVYVALAWKNGYRWRLHARPQSGEPFERKRVGGRVDEKEVRQRLRAAGYRRIQNVEWQDDGRAGTYVAVAWQNGVQYRVTLRGADGSPQNRDRIGQRRAGEDRVRAVVRDADFEAIDAVEFADGAYRVTAWKDGVQYRLRARPRDGRIVNRERIGGRIADDALRARLDKAGYDRVGAIRHVGDGRAGHFVVIAWQGDRKYRLYARAETGDPYRRVTLGQRIDERELRRRLLARGFESVSEIEFYEPDDAEAYYEAVVVKNGRRWRIAARATDGVPTWRTLLEPRAGEDDVAEALRREGYSDVEDVRFVKDRAGGHFTATARRDGKIVRLWISADDGSVYRSRAAAR